jgi:Phage integrase, N-terminal SAM-like domain
MTNATIERKCTKGHKKADGRCSPRCVRWYPRIERTTPDGHGRRRFDYLGGYPTKAAARSALDQALERHSDHPSNPSTVVRGPAHPTLNDLLDHWLAHLQTNKALRLRTIGRYRRLLEQHLRPYLGTLPLSALSTLQVQRLYDQLARDGRKDGKAGGLGPRTIRQVHLMPAPGTRLRDEVAPPAGQPSRRRRTARHPRPHVRGPHPRTGRHPARRHPPGPAAVAARLHRPGRGNRRPHPASCAAWNGTTSTWTPAPCGSARRCPASASNLPAAGRAPTAGVASCWSSAPSRPPPARPC